MLPPVRVVVRRMYAARCDATPLGARRSMPIRRRRPRSSVFVLALVCAWCSLLVAGVTTRVPLPSAAPAVARIGIASVELASAQAALRALGSEGSALSVRDAKRRTSTADIGADDLFDEDSTTMRTDDEIDALAEASMPAAAELSSADAAAASVAAGHAEVYEAHATRTTTDSVPTHESLGHPRASSHLVSDAYEAEELAEVARANEMNDRAIDESIDEDDYGEGPEPECPLDGTFQQLRSAVERGMRMRV
jgi:hypothetical protein